MIPTGGLSGEDKLLADRIDDFFSRSEVKYEICFTHFLDERQCIIAEMLCKPGCKRRDNVRYGFYGGYGDASRRILCVYNEYNPPETEDVPLKCLTFLYRRTDILCHRDFLGSLTDLRLKRRLIGDIIIGEGKAAVFVHDNAVRPVMDEIKKIGRIGVTVRDDLLFEYGMDSGIQKFDVITGTVASLRLDSVLSLSLKLSREKTAAIISSSGVRVNYFEVTEVSRILQCGDVYSVKGYGKFVLKEISGISKKGRLHIVVQKYI